MASIQWDDESAAAQPSVVWDDEVAQPAAQPTPFAERARMGLPARIGSTLLQGATMGFADELAGIGGGIMGGIAGLAGMEGQSFGQGYEETRNRVRNELGALRESNPITSMVAEGAGGLLTGIGLGSKLAQAVPVKSKIGNVMATGGVFGGVSGAGAAKDMESVIPGILSGAATGAATAGVLQPVAAGIGAVGSNIAQRFRPSSATEAAQRKIAEAMMRDKIDPNKLGINMRRMGESGVVADVGGANTAGLLDVVANIPGRTKDLAARLIRERQISRPERLTDVAQRGMAPSGQRFETTMESLAAQQAKARPLYDEAMNLPLVIDDDLANILGRIDKTGAFKDAAKISEITGQPFTLRGQPGERITLNQMNEAKKTLWDIEQAAKDQLTGKATSLSSAITTLRRQFIDKLDDITKDPTTGASVYKEARSVFAEPTQLQSAMELGRKSFNQKAFGIRETLKDLSAAEQEAYRIGAFESFREMAGSQAGQSQLLNLYKDRNVREKMQELFPNESGFRRFANEVFKEEKRRKLEGVRGGSQTFGREAAAEDLAQPVAEFANTARSAATGNIPGVIAGASNLWKRIQTPQQVRDEIGRILLSGGEGGFTSAAGQVQSPATMRIADLMRQMESKRGSRTTAGAIPLSQLIIGR